MHFSMIDKDVRAIVQISINPRFEIKDFLNELRNEWMILGKHECFHQIHHDIIILLSPFLQQISKTFINIFMCVPNYKKPQLNFFENFAGNERRKKCQHVMILVIFHTIVHLKKFLWQWLCNYNFVRRLQCIQTTRTSL